jgi:hypothetical protein
MAERNINLFLKTLTEIKTVLLVILHRMLPLLAGKPSLFMV